MPNTKKHVIKILALLFFLCTGFSVKAQVIANYIGNGSFEQLTSNCISMELKSAKYWNSIDSLNLSSYLFSYCNGMVPNQANTVYQRPRTGKSFAGTTFYALYGINNNRQYLKNRLKKNLIIGKVYCVKFYVNIMNSSTLGSDGFGVYFGNNAIDTISQIYKPITFLTPQIFSLNGIPIIDTLGWTAVTGTFVASGDEKYALIGMFKPNGTMDTVVLNPNMLPLNFTDACIDDVSCIPIDLPAYAGPDKTCIVGDSVFIGRAPDVEIDESCIWYKVNGNGTLSNPMDTIAGMYVKPITTSTYVVRQQFWCSGVKWDTVVVYKDFVGLPPVSSSEVENDIRVFPNPAQNNIEIKTTQVAWFGAGSKLFIYNHLGQLIKENTLYFNQQSTSIDTRDLEEGVYTLLFKNASAAYCTKRLMILRK